MYGAEYPAHLQFWQVTLIGHGANIVARLICQRAVVFVGEYVLHVSVLPGNRLLVFTSAGVKTFEIPEFEKTVPGGWVSTMNKFTPPLHHLPFYI